MRTAIAIIVSLAATALDPVFMIPTLAGAWYFKRSPGIALAIMLVAAIVATIPILIQFTNMRIIGADLTPIVILRWGVGTAVVVLIHMLLQPRKGNDAKV
jgi:hypothetical protein